MTKVLAQKQKSISSQLGQNFFKKQAKKGSLYLGILKQKENILGKVEATYCYSNNESFDRVVITTQ